MRTSTIAAWAIVGAEFYLVLAIIALTVVATASLTYVLLDWLRGR